MHVAMDDNDVEERQVEDTDTIAYRNLQYPRVLVVALGRINEVDAFNNGMLLRNLFGNWPRENLAQIFSSGDTGDKGFFGHYYKLGPQDRRWGRLFYRLKSEAQDQRTLGLQAESGKNKQIVPTDSLPKRLLINTGLYELIFAPRVSRTMQAWVDDFRPDIIFAQGYNLTFARLPILLQKITSAKIAFFTSDDWPSYLYAGLMGEPRLVRWLIRPIVRKAVAHLLAATEVPLAFGQAMAEEYETRYGKTFTVLSHADEPGRFEFAQPVRVHPAGSLTLMGIGSFGQFRWPLLLEANESCRMLNEQGIHIRIAVLSSAIDPEGARQMARASYIDILEDPGNDKLPCYLKGADVLLLAEGFDAGFVSAARFSVSTKAHLFMFSKRPIIVYAHADTGIAKYALAYEWARVVTQRDPQQLAIAIRDLLTCDTRTNVLLSRATEIARRFHTHDANRKLLFNALAGDVKAMSIQT